MAAELVDGELERDARPQRRLLEEEPDRAPGEEGLVDIALALVLQPVGEVEDGEQLFARPVGDAQVIAALQALHRSDARAAGALRRVDVEPGFGEQLAQPLQAGEHPALDRPERLAEPFGELGLREAAVVGELDRLALLGRELAQRLLDDLALGAQPRLFVGRLAGGLRRRRRAGRRGGAPRGGRGRRRGGGRASGSTCSACRARRGTLPAERQTARKASCTASSASARSRTIRSASP